MHCAEHCISVEKLSTHSPFNVPEMVFQVVFRDACVLLLLGLAKVFKIVLGST